MPTPDSKANEMILKFIRLTDKKAYEPLSGLAWIDTVMATQCAIICVEEIIDILPKITDVYTKESDDYKQWQPDPMFAEYWQSVLTILKTKL